jgi:hypothetical protein
MAQPTPVSLDPRPWNLFAAVALVAGCGDGTKHAEDDGVCSLGAEPGPLRCTTTVFDEDDYTSDGYEADAVRVATRR